MFSFPDNSCDLDVRKTDGPFCKSVTLCLHFSFRVMVPDFDVG